MPDLPLIPAAQLGLIVVVLVVLVPLVAMVVMMLSIAPDPVSGRTVESFWGELLAEQRTRGVTFGTPESTPTQVPTKGRAAVKVGRHRAVDVAALPRAGATPHARASGESPVSAASRLPYRSDMTLRELRQAIVARAAERDWQRLEFRWEMSRATGLAA